MYMRAKLATMQTVRSITQPGRLDLGFYGAGEARLQGITSKEAVRDAMPRGQSGFDLTNIPNLPLHHEQ